MKLDFSKNTRRNVIAGAFNRVVGLLFPFLNRTLFLWLMGPAYLGLNGLFSSILGVLALAELGFGTAIVCSMYKPIADDDRPLICAYLRFYRTVYRCIGSVIFLGGLALLPFLKRLVHGDLPPDVDLHILYLLHLTNTAVSYFLFAYRGAVLSAHHRNDVLTNIRTLLSGAQYLTVFLLLIVTRHYPHRYIVYYLYVITTVIFTVIQNLLTMRASNRLFPEIAPRGQLAQERRRKVVSDVASIFMHKIGTVISYSIDNVVLSAFLGLVTVAAYGNYYYVYTAIAGLPALIYSSMAGGFGNKIQTESREANFQLFMRVSRTVSIVIIWCAAMMLAMYQPFIALWTRHKLVQHFLTAELMVVYFYVNQSRQVLLTFKAGAAIWREDRWKPVVGGIVKLAASLLFVRLFADSYKLDGVILASLIGYIFVQIPWESHVLFTVFFDRQQAKVYWRSQARFALLALGVCVVTWAGANAIPPGGMGTVILKGVVAAAISGTLLGVLFRRDLPILLEKMRGRR